MKRFLMLAAALAVPVFFAFAQGSACGQAPSGSEPWRAPLLSTLLQEDEWSYDDFEEEIEEIPPVEDDEPAVEEEQPPLEKQRPAYQPPPAQRGRAGARGWRQARWQARNAQPRDPRRQADGGFRGRPKQFTIKLGIDIGVMCGGDAGRWPEYWGGLPSYDSLLDYDPSVALEATFRICPFFELAAGISHVRLSGNNVMLDWGSTIYVGDMTLTSMWIGPKIALPLGLGKRYWMSRQGLCDSKAISFYFIPISVGFTSMSRLRAEYLGTEFDYYESALNVYFSTRIGFEAQFRGFGFFAEAGFASYGKPEASDDGVLDTRSGAMCSLFLEGGILFAF